MWDWPSGWLTLRLNPQHSVHASCCADAHHTKQNSIQWFWVPAEIFLWIRCFWSLLYPALLLFEAGHWVSSEPLWRDSVGTNVIDAACDWPWAMCYEFLMNLELSVIHTSWLPLLGLGECMKDQATHQGWLLPPPGLRVGQQNSQTTQRSAFTYRLLVRLSHWKSLWLYSSAGLKLHRVEKRDSSM